MALFGKKTLSSITSGIESTITHLENFHTSKLAEIAKHAEAEVKARLTGAAIKEEVEKAKAIANNLRALIEKK